MRFHLGEELLSALRKRQKERQKPEAAAPSERPFMEHVGELFSTGDVKRVADGYVGAMSSWQDEIEAAHDAFLLDPGMGPMLYLTTDGRVLSDGRGWDGEVLRECSDDEAISAIVVGAKKTGISALLDLLPRKPDGVADCAACAGTRWIQLPGFQSKMVCWTCHGRGW